MKKLLLVSAMTVASVISQAAEVEVLVGLQTVHLRDHAYNNDNNFLGIAVGDIVVGTYNNSYYKRSNLLAYTNKHKYSEHLSFGLTLGAVSGYCELSYGNVFYHECPKKVLNPVIAPFVSYDTQYASVRLVNLGAAFMLLVTANVGNVSPY